MDKRFFLALVLTAIVIIGTPLLFPGTGRRAPVPAASDTRRADTTHAKTGAARPALNAERPTVQAPATINSSSTAIMNALVETTTVRTARSTYLLSSRGAAPISVTLDSYPSRRPGATGAKAELIRAR